MKKLGYVLVGAILSCQVQCIENDALQDGDDGEVEQLTQTDTTVPDNSNPSSTPPFIDDLLPADQINDTVRSSDFVYQSTVKVRLELDIDYYGLEESSIEKNSNSDAELIRTNPVPSVVAIKAEGSDINTFIGMTDGSGKLSKTIDVPAGDTNYSMKISTPGFHDREVTIDNMASLESVNRVMSVASSPQSIDNFVTDGDGDTVPDAYDTFPADPARAFSITAPAENFYTVAFEDNFPNLGDGDYNDFVAAYGIILVTDAANNVKEIGGFVEAIHDGAGYDHIFGIHIRHSGAAADVTITEYDNLYNYTGERTSASTDDSYLELFLSTDGSFSDVDTADGLKTYGQYREFTVVFDVPVSEENLGALPLDPYLYIKNTTYDVHLVGEDPLPGTNNPAETLDMNFLDGDGYPRGLLVPNDWRSPVEGTLIGQAYPDFDRWVESNGATNMGWYLNNNAIDANVVDRDLGRISDSRRLWLVFQRTFTRRRR